MRKLLVANRGEIAIRVMRTAREMGIRTVAVFSEADKNALHVAFADEAVFIGDSPPSASYLDGARVLAAARSSGADAIHPGYGFLSERAEFSQSCSDAGIVFVGPPASAMRLLGAKSSAKALAVESGVPIVPGMFEPGATRVELLDAASRIGFPVMLKASAGGGGRGMRAVRSVAEFEEAFDVASDEALKSFGDGAMMVEKLIDRPRHVEVQILADSYGNVAALFERECSLQRRHQKVVEEAPAPAIQQALISWPEMRDAAVRMVRAAGYVNAGTVEFIVDPADSAFYFLEVNARLQVEHPVTEAITGLDLVREQIRVASGEPIRLSEGIFAGDRRYILGHAIEARIVAEDPAAGFLPSTGTILAWAEPKGPGIRVDSGYGAGQSVSRFYDSLVAKVIAHAATRVDAISRLRAALLDFHVLGVKTNIAYLLDVLDSPGFLAGGIDTSFLGRQFPEWLPPLPPKELGSIARSAQGRAANEPTPAVACVGVWQLDDRFRNVR